MKKISGKIINHDSSFIGTIEFDDRIKLVKQESQKDFNNIIIPGFINLHCHGGNGFDTMGGL